MFFKVYRTCFILIFIIVLSDICALVHSRGLLLLYRPKDVTLECAYSEQLRYDITYGMGLSDTVTLVLRTLSKSDYECTVDITTENNTKMIIVIRFPTTIAINCFHNPMAFAVMKMNKRLQICERTYIVHQDQNSRFWIIYTTGRFRFQFKSNSSINSDLNAYLYQVTATTVRLRKYNGRCFNTNETECYSQKRDEFYCMTSGVECDGINNCGVDAWYDERKSNCVVPISRLGYSPILTVIIIIICLVITAAHIILQSLPRAASLFIFNANEDNRLCLNPVFVTSASDYNVPQYVRIGSSETSDSSEETKGSLVPTSTI